MKLYVIHLGIARFALPLDTSICIQDLIRDGVPLETSWDHKFNYKLTTDKSSDCSLAIEEVEVPEDEAAKQEEEDLRGKIAALADGAVPPAPETPPDPNFTDDIPF